MLAGGGSVAVTRRNGPTIRAFALTLAVALAGLGLLLLGSGLARPLGGIAFVTVLIGGVVLHLENLTAPGPALSADPGGLRLARWRPVAIPWTEITGVRARTVGTAMLTPVVMVTEEFRAEYRRAVPLWLRLGDAVQQWSAGPAFVLPPGMRADAYQLADWLDEESRNRNPRRAAERAAEEEAAPMPPFRRPEFTRVRLREGYSIEEVDSFLDRVEAEFARTPARLHPEELDDARFTPVRLRPGYDMGEVDEWLDATAALLRDRQHRD